MSICEDEPALNGFRTIVNETITGIAVVDRYPNNFASGIHFKVMPLAFGAFCLVPLQRLILLESSVEQDCSVISLLVQWPDMGLHISSIL